MNWSKAKSILILALIFTNIILLGIFLYDRIKLSPFESSKEFALESKSVLEESNIRVQTHIPTKDVKLPVLKVSFETFTSEELNKKFFGNKGNLEKDDGNLKLLRMGNSSISLIDNRRLLYERDSTGKQLDISLEEAENLVKDFLSSKEYAVDDLQLVGKRFHEGIWELSYTMIYKGNYLESTYMGITIEGNQVIRMDRLWIDVLEEIDEKDILEPAPKAILALLDRPEAKGRTVKSIAPCYLFNPEEQGALEELTRSLVGRSSLSWRVVLDNGEEIMLRD